jgi:hypothetical protein
MQGTLTMTVEHEIRVADSPPAVAFWQRQREANPLGKRRACFNEKAWNC